MSRRSMSLCAALFVMAASSATPSWGQSSVLVEEGSSMTYLHNAADPGIGMSWTSESFNDASWANGVYGIGYDTDGSASSLTSTSVPSGMQSIYTRSWFQVDDLSAVTTLFAGADFDDGYAMWINGTEVFRSPQMPSGSLDWDTSAGSHESSNGSSPSYRLEDISSAAIPLLDQGTNLLAVAVWNTASSSSDLVLVPQLRMNAPVQLARGPYLQSASPTSVVVRWRTLTPTSTRVRYGLTPGNLDGSADGAGSTVEHEVELSGLEPATRYYYSVGTSGGGLVGGDSGHYFETSPIPGSRQPTRVWVIGDSGTANGDARAVRDAYTAFNGSRHTNLWLMLGDNAYDDGTDSEYQDAVFDMYPEILKQTAVWPTLGNHDARSASSSSLSGPYYDIFTLPTAGEAGGVASGTEAYYSFDYGNIHFICLNSHDVSRSTSGAMLTWLEQDLMNHDQDWTIAFWHHPPYTKGSHNSDSESRLVEMRENALPILEEWGVDLVFSGHSHSYERTYLLDGHYGSSSSLTSDMKLDGGDGRSDGDGTYDKPTLGPGTNEGAVYIVAGSSGKVSSSGNLDHAAMFTSLRELGSVVLDVEGGRLDARFIDDQGQLRDYFTIEKGGASPPQADFIGSPLSGGAPLAVQFTDLSSGATSWAWDFDGDDVTDSTQSDPTHTYTADGSYTVRLTVSNSNGSDTRTRTDYVVVSTSAGPPAPTNLRFGNP